MDKCLLHVCCAPCSIAIIDELKDRYDLTVYFYNPNIFPQEEYFKRKAEVVNICEEYNSTCHPREGGDPVAQLPIKFVDVDYETEKWAENTKGLENELEGGKRCVACFNLRLSKAGEYAAKNGFDIFATTLTSGRNKKADVIHPLGKKIADKFGLKFLDIDWKTDGRQEKSIKLCNEKNVYRQDYCGCKYSLKNSKSKISNPK